MEKLINGVKHFRSHTHPDREALYNELATSQAPRVLFITCSDSRVVPHEITNSGPGDLFVIRNAGNVIPPFVAGAGGEEATLEFAMAVLKVQHIIVCGHSNCGAMKGLLNPESLQSVPAVSRWLDLARPAREVVEATLSNDINPQAKLNATIEANVLRQLDNLRTHPSVAAALANEQVSLHGWVYDIPSGAIKSYGEKEQAFYELADELRPLAPKLKLVASSFA